MNTDQALAAKPLDSNLTVDRESAGAVPFCPPQHFANDQGDRLEIAYTGWGAAYGGESQFNLVISDYTRALEINPRFAQALCNRGSAYLSTGNSEPAFDGSSQHLNVRVALQQEFQPIPHHPVVIGQKNGNAHRPTSTMTRVP